MRLSVALIALMPGLALAETPMTGAEFQAYVGTDTLTYRYGGGFTGTADYGPNRTLRWQFAGDACVNAHWHQDGDALCFAFDVPQMSACWRFYHRPGGIVGIGLGTAADQVISETARSDKPLSCADFSTGA